MTQRVKQSYDGSLRVPSVAHNLLPFFDCCTLIITESIFLSLISTHVLYHSSLAQQEEVAKRAMYRSETISDITSVHSPMCGVLKVLGLLNRFTKFRL